MSLKSTSAIPPREAFLFLLLNLQNLVNWGREREYRERTVSIREVLQAHVHFTVVLSQD